MGNTKYVNYDADNKNDYDFKSIIIQEINYRNFENKDEVVELREYAFDGYRDRYILVINDNDVIGYLIYGNDKLFKSSIIKYYFFYEGFKDHFYIQQVILEFMSRNNYSSVCILHEANCDVLIQLGFIQSCLRYGDSFYVYFYDKDMLKVVDFIPLIKQKNNETIGSYYYRKMKIIQNLLFTLLMAGLSSGIFIFSGIIYILETIYSSEPLTLLGISLVILDVLIAIISIPCYFLLKSTAKSRIDYDLRASGFRVKLDYYKMFF
ncbi:MAG: hypothetical protein A2Y16_04675 [Tenericutes bacterium GWF2_57_13]|nr:MAG: hypothetical protein A2Y16_04675 [Tenericutes bacterium GWF2_57_13]